MSAETKNLVFSSFNEKFAFNDDGFISYTGSEQKLVEDYVLEEYKKVLQSGSLELHRKNHAAYLLTGLEFVERSYSTLDASRTWMCYWSVHALNILGAEIPEARKKDVVKFIKTCEHPEGGYGGGPGQYAHLATTYAAVMALASMKTNDALDSIDLMNLSSFLKRMKNKDGSFSMHVGGEADIRGAYCAVAVASMCGILSPELIDGTAEWIVKCQTYEGGFGGEPGVEAHGGYTYCGVAALALMNRFNVIDTMALLKWLTNRQTRLEGGFNGRTNKLVDGCYSFWQAGAAVIIAEEFFRHENRDYEGGWLFDKKMLEEYILVACQDSRGGLRDKPEKKRDMYHTCYVLSGLSLAQGMDIEVLGGVDNKVNNISALFNVVSDVPKQAHAFFEKKLYNMSR